MSGALLPKRCSRCETPFECGVNADACWCQQLPVLPAAQIDATADCLCPQCLAAATEVRAPTAEAQAPDRVFPPSPGGGLRMQPTEGEGGNGLGQIGLCIPGESLEASDVV